MGRTDATPLPFVPDDNRWAGTTGKETPMTGKAVAMAAVALLVLGPGGVRAQGTFEGMVAYRINQPGGGTSEMRYFQKGERIRHEMQAGPQTTATIFNGATGESMMLIPARKQYMVMNVNEMSKQMGPAAAARSGAQTDFSRMSVRSTGRRETIAGVVCEHVIFSDSRGGSTDICGASGMGFMGAGKGMGSGPSTASLMGSKNPQMVALTRRGFFPLKMTMTGPNGSLTWVVTKVDRRRLDDSLFGPPAGYTKFAMPTMPPGMPNLPQMPVRH